MRIDGPQITGSFSLNGDGVQDIDIFATTSSLNTYTSSMATTMSHVLTATHSLNTFTGSANNRMVSIEGKTGSYATTGSNTFVGLQTIQGSIVPSAHATYDLGSAGYNFRHLYLSSASLYIDGTKVLGSTTQELQITTDNGQSFKILEAGSDTITLQSNDGNITLATSGGGDVILDPTTGIIALKGTTQVYAGNKVRSSDGNNIVFGDGLTVSGSVTITGFIEAQELRTTYISSSILYRSGSTKFGDELTDTHAFSGSVLISGSLSVPESNLVSGSSQIDVLSTTNIARLATTGSNTFRATQTIGSSISPTSGGNILTLYGSGSATYAQVYTTTNHATFFETSTNNGTIVSRLQSQNASFVGTLTNNTFDIVAGGNVIIRTTGSGLVGINKSTTPNATLDVNGSLLVSGSITSTGNIRLGENPSINWISNTLTLETLSNAIPVVRINGAASYDPRFEIWNSGNAARTILLHTAGDSYINNVNNFGLGTSSPAHKLDVDGGSDAATLRVSTTNTGAGVASLILANSSKTAFNDGVKISHGGGYTKISDLTGTTIMSFDMSNARVGIKTTTPSGTFNVQSAGADGIVLSSDSNDSNNSGRLFFMRTGGEGWSIMNNAGNLSFRSNAIPTNTSGSERMRLDSSYNLILNNGLTVAGTTNHTGAVRMNSGSAGNSPKITFGTEDESVPGNKSIYLENYWMVLQPHVNEGMRIRFVNGSGSQTETLTFQSSNTSINTPLSVSGALTTNSGYHYSQGSVNLRKLVNVGDNTTTTLLSFNQNGSYSYIGGGEILITFVDPGSPWGVYVWKGLISIRTVQYGSLYSTGIQEIASRNNLDGTFTVSAQTSKDGGVANAIINVVVTTSSGISGQAYVSFNGWISGGSQPV